MGVNTLDTELFDACLSSFDVMSLLKEIETKASQESILIVGLREFSALFGDTIAFADPTNLFALESNELGIPVTQSTDSVSSVYFLGIQVGGVETHPSMKRINTANKNVFAPVQVHFSSVIKDTTHGLIEPYFSDNKVVKSSLIVLSGLNNAASLEQMLLSLKKYTAPSENIEIIVVVNGSDDATCAMPAKVLGANYNTTVLVLPQNMGIAGGYNAGMKIAKGKYTVLMQDDITFSKSTWLAELEYYMDANPKIGLLGGFRGGYYFQNDKTIVSGDNLSSPYIGIGSELFGKCKWSKLDDHLVQVDSVNCMLTIHRSNIAFYDEELLPNGIEDIAFSYEIRKKGYEVFVTNSGITHGDLVSASRKENRMSIFFKLVRRKLFPSGIVQATDLKKRLSRGYHFAYFKEQYGDMLQPIQYKENGSIPSLDDISSSYKTIPRDPKFK